MTDPDASFPPRPTLQPVDAVASAAGPSSGTLQVSARVRRTDRLLAWAPPILAVPLLIAIGLQNFLLFHVGAEFFSSMVGVVLFFVATQTYRFTGNGFLAILGAGYFWVALLDGLHALHYDGMGIYADAGPNLATQYWIATRLLEAGLLVAATAFIDRGAPLKRAFALFSVIAIGVIALIETGRFPDAYIDGVGLTPFKIYAEYFVVALLGVAAWRVLPRQTALDPQLRRGMLIALGLTAAAEFCFTLYMDVYGLLNMTGHILKIFSFWILLDATVRLTLTEPFRQLAADTTAFDHVSQPALLIDEHNAIAHANTAFAERVGFAPAQLIGQPVVAALAGYLGEAVPSPLVELIDRRQSARQAVFALPGSGGEIEVDLVYYEHPDLGMAGSLLVIDRSRRVAAERALEAERWRAQQALDNTEQGLWDWDIQTGAVTFSDRIMTMVGDPPGSWPPNVSAWETRIHPEDKAGVTAALTAHLAGETPVYEVEHRLIGTDGRVVWVLDKGRVVSRDPEGRPLRAIGTHTDITARKQMERNLAAALAEARAASRAKSDFLAAMSHELRTPLNAVIGFSEMMSTEALGPIGLPRYREYAEDIRGAGRDLLSLIDDVLDLSKIEAGRMVVAETDIVLADKLAAVVKLVRPAATAHGVDLVMDRPRAGLRLRADRRMVKQMLLNLLSNATKFTGDGGRVTLSCAQEAGGGIVLRVADTGVGMSAAEIKTAVEPFAQVGNPLVSRPEHGTGLGLALVDRMMALHGGAMRIDSKPGRGTVVSLHFPPERTIDRSADMPSVSAA